MCRVNLFLIARSSRYNHSMDWVTTSTLLHSLRSEDDPRSWERLVNRFRGGIVGFAQSYGFQSHDAEDVAQEALLTFISEYRLGKYDRSKGRLGRWLFGIAYRKMLQSWEKAALRMAKAAPEAAYSSFWAQLPDEAAASITWDVEWERMVLEQCLAQVREEVEPTTYQAFEMVVRFNRSPDEVAIDMGVPIKLVYNAKHRVLNRIRDFRAELENVA